MQTEHSNNEKTGYFANLVFDGLQLLIPQSDVYSLEPSIDMQINSDTNGSIGYIQQTERWSLYALDNQLNVLASNPQSYHIAVLLKNVQPVYGLLCEQIHTLSADSITLYPLPTAMYSPNSPVLALAVVDSEIRFLSSANALGRLLQDGTQ